MATAGDRTLSARSSEATHSSVHAWQVLPTSGVAGRYTLSPHLPRFRHTFRRQPQGATGMIPIVLDTYAALLENQHELFAYCPKFQRWAAINLAELVAQGRGGESSIGKKPRGQDCGTRGQFQLRAPAYRGAETPAGGTLSNPSPRTSRQWRAGRSASTSANGAPSRISRANSAARTGSDSACLSSSRKARRSGSMPTA